MTNFARIRTKDRTDIYGIINDAGNLVEEFATNAMCCGVSENMRGTEHSALGSIELSKEELYRAYTFGEIDVQPEHFNLTWDELRAAYPVEE